MIECHKSFCNICLMIFDKRDKDYNDRLIIHTRYHDSKVKGKLRHNDLGWTKRNMVKGVPIYKDYYD